MIFENCAALLSSALSLSSFLSLQVQYASFLLGGIGRIQPFAGQGQGGDPVDRRVIKMIK